MKRIWLKYLIWKTNMELKMLDYDQVIFQFPDYFDARHCLEVRLEELEEKLKQRNQ